MSGKKWCRLLKTFQKEFNNPPLFFSKLKLFLIFGWSKTHLSFHWKIQKIFLCVFAICDSKYLLKDILNKKSCYDSHSSWQASGANTITFESFFVNIWSHNQWRTTGETSNFAGFQKLNMARSLNNCEIFIFTIQTQYDSLLCNQYHFYSKNKVLL